MFNSLLIAILRLNGKEVTEGNFILAFVEFVATLLIIAIVRTT